MNIIKCMSDMKKLKVKLVYTSDCENMESATGWGLCKECEYNCGFCHNAKGELCVECGFNKDLSLKQNSNEGTRKTNGR